MLIRTVVSLAVTFLPAVSFAAGPYKDPDSLEVKAAARAALANARVLDIQPRVLDVVGMTLGLEAVLKDLAAKVSDTQIKIELSADVLFDFDKYSLRPEATESLQKVGQVVAEYPNSPLLIEGYTDGKGTHSYNVALSENRAGAVRQWLIKNAVIRPARISTKGWGELKPVAPNTNPNGSDNPAGRQKNRRVELTLQTK